MAEPKYSNGKTIKEKVEDYENPFFQIKTEDIKDIVLPPKGPRIGSIRYAGPDGRVVDMSIEDFVKKLVERLTEGKESSKESNITPKAVAVTNVGEALRQAAVMTAKTAGKEKNPVAEIIKEVAEHNE